MAQAATAAKALVAKTEELIALGIAVAVRCDDCIAFHAKAAAEQGATRDEVSETLGRAIFGSRPIHNVREPCVRSIHAVRSFKGRAMTQRNVWLPRTA